MAMRKFMRSPYYRLFLLAFGLEVVVDTLFIVRPDHEQHPSMHFLGGLMGIVAVITIAIGGFLLVYNPQLNRYPDPPVGLNLASGGGSDAEDEDCRIQTTDWPEWKPVAGCIVLLTVGLAVFGWLIS